MAYICNKPEDWEKEYATKPVGDGQCVAFIQEFTKAPHTSLWKEGVKAKGDLTILKGTAIATFSDGKYKSLSTGNHAAIYLNQDAVGIWVLDQWKKQGAVKKRCIRFDVPKGTSPSNDGNAFSVID